MLIRQRPIIPSSEITDERIYLNRQAFMAGAVALAVCSAVIEGSRPANGADPVDRVSRQRPAERVEPTGRPSTQVHHAPRPRAVLRPEARVLGFTVDWPCIEGLRLDEARHPLTLLTVWRYGQVLPNQNGARTRVVVSWKYGFKTATSIVRIRLAAEESRTAWTKAALSEYGFSSNVNPR
jgi:DMSO/TMAO reductase YedYZ molybdopterin-dependent catalytic subunit